MVNSVNTLLKTSEWLKNSAIPLRVGGGWLQAVPAPGDYTETKHHHDFDELTVIAAGKGIHSIDDKDYNVQAGDVFVITRGHSHYFHHRENMIHLNVMYNLGRLPLATPYLSETPGFNAIFKLEPFLIKARQSVASLRLTPRQLQRVRHIWEVMQHEENERLPGFEVIMINRFQELVVFLSRLYVGLHSSRKTRILAIENTIRFIDTQYAQPLTLADLYKNAGMSRPAFMKHFKESTGLSPMAYLINTRIEQSCKLLRCTNNSITDIALSAGFTNSNYFARAFRNIMKISPREFRALNSSSWMDRS
jgi:AraC-like DNA-binding protein